MLRDRFKSELQKAMKSREALKVSTLRLILAAIKDRDLDSRSKGNGDAIADSNILEILSKMVKQRKESISAYKKAGRNDLADQEDNEIKIISEFLPQKLTNGELKKITFDNAIFKESKEIFEDLIVASHNDGKSKLKKKNNRGDL